VLKEALALDANDLTANRALGLYYVQTKRLPEPSRISRRSRGS
jgi:hypothetical protein